MSADHTLSNSQIEGFSTAGYLVVENLLSPKEVEDFLENERRTKEDPGPDDLRHHTRDPAWEYVTGHPRITAIVRRLIGGNPRVVQSMYMAKQPEGGTGIALHQDTHYIRNEPNTLMACWLAFSETGPDNGGLCVVSGSNHRGLLAADQVRDTRQHASWEREYAMSDRDGLEWTETMHSFDIPGISQDELTRLTVPLGGGVFFTGMTIHGSFANESEDRERLAFATHYVREETWVYRRDIQETVPV